MLKHQRERERERERERVHLISAEYRKEASVRIELASFISERRSEV